MAVLIVTLLLTQVMHVHGKLTVLRGPQYHGLRELLCVSEDDGSALAWNIKHEKYTYNIFKYYPNKDRFYSTCKFRASNDCEMNRDESCLKLWDREHWELTYSMDTPMGAVFDQRWEDHFLHTRNHKATLKSPTFLLRDNVTCIQLLIGLCSVCDADIVLRDAINHNVLGLATTKGSSVSAAHELPMWQSVKVDRNLSTPSYNRAKIEVIPRLSLPIFNPLWAIANVRECRPKGIDKLDKPEITFTNQTTIVATVPIKWEEEYEKEELFYIFRIKSPDEQFVQQISEKISNKSTKLIGRFKNLQPDTTYQIMCILFISLVQITSDWKTVKTECNLPYAPGNFTYSFSSNSTVDLGWLHPLKTCGHHLRCFRITIQKTWSNLKNSSLPESKTYEYLITHYMRNYSTRLYLLPSTRYNISIQTVAITNESSHINSLEILMPPNVDLDRKLKISTQSGSIIQLHIPNVLNDTRDSITYIVLLESNICEQFAKLPKNLLAYIGEDRIKHVLQVVKRPVRTISNLFNNEFSK
ncbi:hypothetical protein EAI_07198 [Harpegnathos saltator]|uniref:Fibronectin type-III domain-containing protein n=1 Tax=Harpegnathos saltator TaxID=610380 RepID=E2B9P8_HARSA|nr:hypothetical protein EAI_07198 [Harpegnathos saltator]